jgi:hypothetical protein
MLQLCEAMRANVTLRFDCAGDPLLVGPHLQGDAPVSLSIATPHVMTANNGLCAVSCIEGSCAPTHSTQPSGTTTQQTSCSIVLCVGYAVHCRARPGNAARVAGGWVRHSRQSNGQVLQQ